MKKNVIICLVFLAATTICCEKYPPETQCPCGKIEINKKEYIAMCIIPNIVTENSVNVLRMENYTKINMGYGTVFSMKYFNDNSWENIEFDFMFTAIAFGVNPKTSKEEGWNLYSLTGYNNYKKGKYKIVKGVWLYNYPDPPEYYLSAEFELK
jgi:hypothetical protein